MKRVLAVATAVGAVLLASACGGGSYTYDQFAADLQAATGKAPVDGQKAFIDAQCASDKGASYKALLSSTAKAAQGIDPNSAGAKTDLTKANAAVDKYCAANS